VDVAELARQPDIRVALEWFRRERAWINEQHLKLCRVAAPTFFEEKRAAYLEARFRELGWVTRIDKAGNVLAERPDVDPGTPQVALTAHLDTVLVPRVPEEIYVSSEDGSFRGPGVGDNGAGLTGLLALAALWNQYPDVYGHLPHSPLLVANVGEEGEGNLSGMRFLCRPHAARPVAFVVLDGPETGFVTSKALGSRRFEVIVSGPGGHSWSDHGKGNAAHALARVMHEFLDSMPRPHGPRFSYNFGLIHGGTSINAIPEQARAKVDLRSEDPAMIESLAANLEYAVEAGIAAENAAIYPRGAQSSARVVAQVKEIGSRPAGELAADSALAQAIVQVDRHLQIRSQFECASTDANVPLALGIPAISIGAGGSGGGAHTPGEWYHPEGRDLGLRRIFLLLGLLLSQRQ
jgi:tripeptide aminopeptidase